MGNICSREDVWRICAELKGVENATCDLETHRLINSHVTPIWRAAMPTSWEKPSKIEAEIDGVIRDIRKLRQRILNLDSYAKALARSHAIAPEREVQYRTLAESAADAAIIAEAVAKLDEIDKRPKETWVDFAAVAHLDALANALVKPAQTAIELAPPGAGRRPNRQAYRVAAAAARAFRDLTGTDPTFWNGGETPFSRMVAEIYRCAGIEADLRKPIEAAMHELKGDG
ncbi:hypothetical protein FALB51S_02491 [Frigidibacter albus]